MIKSNHCPNGHLIFYTLNGRGCLAPKCEYRVEKPKKKAKEKVK